MIIILTCLSRNGLFRSASLAHGYSKDRVFLYTMMRPSDAMQKSKLQQHQWRFQGGNVFISKSFGLMRKPMDKIKRVNRALVPN